MALFGSLSTVRAQLALSDKFATAFAYVEACLRAGSSERALLDGLAAEQTQRVDLGGGVFALAQASMTLPGECRPSRSGSRTRPTRMCRR